ncbi:hypothetical protein CCO57_22095 [Salmonella enterica subsp. indica serovar Marseille]|nr:hypothetical protein [Salmonella enterica subsp. enterica serovar Chandans]EAB6494170.1 hypothetical protein [Salmonella enterica subsp. enterica]EBV4613745.1 hypothetical protein [Salmonella enterica subsp. enterica serovar Solt]EBW3574972.1 hypothetical protein [Salmonella enterica subsp. enterica serovar Agona]EBX5008512.1 hypothetical protein [Salmonella enterica subsp. enterica serovar Sarajane]OZU28576.1 hypothetical protein CCO52_23190 [Salmonella enterica subsp. enterica serovar Ber
MKPNWKREGMKSNGLYNAVKKSPLTDNPPIGSEHREVIKGYISHYESTKERTPSYTHLNKRYGLRASKAFYEALRK